MPSYVLRFKTASPSNNFILITYLSSEYKHVRSYLTDYYRMSSFKEDIIVQNLQLLLRIRKVLFSTVLPEEHRRRTASNRAS